MKGGAWDSRQISRQRCLGEPPGAGSIHRIVAPRRHGAWQKSTVERCPEAPIGRSTGGRAATPCQTSACGAISNLWRFSDSGRESLDLVVESDRDEPVFAESFSIGMTHARVESVPATNTRATSQASLSADTSDWDSSVPCIRLRMIPRPGQGHQPSRRPRQGGGPVACFRAPGWGIWQLCGILGVLAPGGNSPPGRTHRGNHANDNAAR